MYNPSTGYLSKIIEYFLNYNYFLLLPSKIVLVSGFFFFFSWATLLKITSLFCLVNQNIRWVQKTQYKPQMSIWRRIVPLKNKRIY